MTGPLRAALMPVRGRKRYRFHASVTFGFLGFCCLVQRAQSSMGQEEARLYDRNLQHFSPEGRIYQVQYAELAARRGNPVVAVSNSQDALALCVERRRASALEEPGIAWEKVGEIQQGTYMGFAGLAADGRRLLDRTRLFAENYRLKYAELPGVKDIAYFIGDLQHRNTFVRAQRPYGVSCVVGGVDTASSSRFGKLQARPCIYATEPSGVVQEYRAVCVGEHAEIITGRLEARAGELAKMRAGQLARFGARVLWDVREGEDKQGAPAKVQGRTDAEGGLKCLEVLVLRRMKREDAAEGEEGWCWKRLLVKDVGEIEALERILDD